MTASHGLIIKHGNTQAHAAQASMHMNDDDTPLTTTRHGNHKDEGKK